MQKTGLSDAEVCPSGPMPDKKLCKAMNFHYSTLAVYYFYHYLAGYHYVLRCTKLWFFSEQLKSKIQEGDIVLYPMSRDNM